MNHPLSRRGLFGAFGTVSVATLLGACSSNGTTTSTTVPTTGGGLASVQPTISPSSATMALLDQANTCTLAPEMTEGPYYFDANAIRSDIREDREGTEFRLAMRIQAGAECAPLSNAVVSIWHCDALGLYSRFGNPSRGGGGRDDERYLRGAQVTNADGIVEFVTIYPGWYTSRAVHIHLKVFIDNQTEANTQLFFDESFTDAVYQTAPYNTHPGRNTRIDNDYIYTQADRNGAPILITLVNDDATVLGAANIVINQG